LILRYPKGAAPQLLYGRTDHTHRANKIDDYLLGHYVLDPFYGRAEYCSDQGLSSLRDVIEEDFAASEYYKTHYQASGLIGEMCFCCVDGAGGHLNLSLSRAVGRSHFTPAELEAARAIAPAQRSTSLGAIPSRHIKRRQAENSWHGRAPQWGAAGGGQKIEQSLWIV
jgi:hypothetical protein